MLPRVQHPDDVSNGDRRLKIRLRQRFRSQLSYGLISVALDPNETTSSARALLYRWIVLRFEKKLGLSLLTHLVARTCGDLNRSTSTLQFLATRQRYCGPSVFMLATVSSSEPDSSSTKPIRARYVPVDCCSIHDRSLTSQEADKSPSTTCHTAPVYRPTRQDLEHFDAYVCRNFTEWESHGLVVLDIPSEYFQEHQPPPKVLEELLQRTLVQPRIQFFPQFARAGGATRASPKRLHKAKPRSLWPTFPESTQSMTAAAYRDQALADHRQLVHWIESRLGEENTTIHDAAKKSALEALTCFQRRPLDERVSMLETCFWEALERGFDGHSGQTLYAIDVLDLPGGSTTSGGVPWLPAGIHAYTVEATTGVALCQKPTRAVERPPRPLSLLNLWPNAGGINEPMAYLGSTLSRFGLHVEDMHLCSLSMLWSGEPKVWYVVPAAFAQDLERLLAEKWSATHPDADAYLEVPSASISKDTVSALTSKSLLISPSALARHQIPVYRTVQRPGQLVLTMPRAYHCGFNCGWNLAEAVNWAPIGWLAYCRSAIAWERRFLKPGTVNDLMLVLVQALLELNGGNVPSWPCRNLNLVRRLLLPCIRWSRALDEWVRIHHRNGNRAGRCTGNQPICWIRCSTACLEAAKELSRWQHKLKLCGQPCWWKRSHQRAWETVMHTLTHGKIFRLQNLALLHVDECLSLEHHWWRDAICVSTLFCSTCRAACGTTFSICLSCLQYRGRSIQGIRCEEHLRLVCDHEHSSDGAVDAAEGLASFRGARMIQSVTCEGSDCQNLNWEMHSLPLLIVSHIPPRNVMRRMLRRWNDYACLAKQNRALGDVCVSDLQSVANESSRPFESVELERIAFVPDRAFMSESRNLGNYRYLQGCAIIRGDGMEVSSIQESER